MLLPNSRWLNENSNVVDKAIQNSVNLNRSLIFNKYLFWNEDDNNRPTLDYRRKKGFLKNEQFNIISKIKTPLTSENFKLLKSRKNSLYQSTIFNLTTRTRVIVNHGGDSLLENSIAIHPYYGFPVIPGSAIKGVTRHFCEEFKDIDKNLITKIFGNSPIEKESEKGSIIFLDAWPTNIINLFFEIDVFTPHYQEYYEGRMLPTDNQNPVPVNFFAVKKGVPFEFTIAPSSKYKKEDSSNLLIKTKNLIQEALQTYGIGAKTGSNYGYFE